MPQMRTTNSPQRQGWQLSQRVPVSGTGQGAEHHGIVTLAMMDGLEGVYFLAPTGHYVVYSWTWSVLLLVVPPASRAGPAHSRCSLFAEWRGQLWCSRLSESSCLLSQERGGFLGAFPPLPLPAAASYSAGSHYSLSAFHSPGAPGALSLHLSPTACPA